MIVCVPVTPADEVDHSWGRAPRVAVADVQNGEVVAWQVFDVSWDTLHDTGTDGSHHARVSRFLKEHGVQAVVAPHMGPPMVNILDRMGIGVRYVEGGDARHAVVAAVRAATN